jgi:peptidoglycan/LPS O-acetylase OafA/YrhL
MGHSASEGQQTTSEILPLTSIRGVAALWVMYGHLLGPVLRVVGDSHPEARRLLTNLARGRSICGRYIFRPERLHNDRRLWNAGDAARFYLHRFARVYPLHVLVLGAAITGFYLLQYKALQPDAYSSTNLIFYLTLTSCDRVEKYTLRTTSPVLASNTLIKSAEPPSHVGTYKSCPLG